MHADPVAEQSARAVRAKAYTVGTDVVFGAGQYAPERSEGKRLLAHELTHVVQQAGSRTATVQRQPDNPDVPPVPGGPGPDSDLEGALLQAVETSLFTLIAEANQPGALVLKQRWIPIRKWIIEGARTGRRPPQALAKFPGLGAPDLVAALSARSRAERTGLADGLRDAIVKRVGSATPDVLRREFAMIDKDILDRIEIEHSQDPFVGYVAMREDIKRRFGSIAAFNKYFTSLVPPNFPSDPKLRIHGKSSFVHPKMQTALENAEKLLNKRNQLPAVIQHLSGVVTDVSGKHHRGYWGAKIRENRNDPVLRDIPAAHLSEHSFGYAIDVNADWNPNFARKSAAKERTWETVRELTGFDVFGEETRLATPAQPYDVVLGAAQKYGAASEQFREIFSSEAHLQKAMGTEASQAGAPVAADMLFKAVVDVSTAASKDDKRAAVASLTSMLDATMKAEEERLAIAANKRSSDPGPVITPSPNATAMEDPIAITIITSRLRRAVKSRVDFETSMMLVKEQLTMPTEKPTSALGKLGLDFVLGKGTSEQIRKAKKAEVKRLGLDFLYDRKLVADLRKLSPDFRTTEAPDLIRRYVHPGARSADARTLAKRLLDMHNLFLDTFVKRDPTGSKIAVGSGGSLKGAAAHGFTNLMPELVAALTASDGGGLRWLGAGQRAKDWHHFELQPLPPITAEGPWETDVQERGTPAPTQPEPALEP